MNSPEGTQSLNALCSELIEDVTEILFSLYLSAIGAYILNLDLQFYYIFKQLL